MPVHRKRRININIEKDTRKCMYRQDSETDTWHRQIWQHIQTHAARWADTHVHVNRQRVKHEHTHTHTHTHTQSSTLVAHMHTTDGLPLYRCSDRAARKWLICLAWIFAPTLCNLTVPTSTVRLWQFNIRQHRLVWVRRVERIENRGNFRATY